MLAVAENSGAGRAAHRDRLAARRRALGLTQEDLAGVLGVERSTVGRWEAGVTRPLPWIQPKLAKVLRVPAGQLAELLAGAVAAGPGRPGPTVPVPRQLPAAVADFTGRAAELAALTATLDQAGASAPGTVVISAIGGTAGIGKTALALHWAHQIARRFADGQLHVNLRGFDPTGTPVIPAEAIRGFLEALGVPPERIPPSPDAQAGLYRSMVADKRMLIVLDNASDEQQVRPLLPASPASLVLVTSRNQLSGLPPTAPGCSASTSCPPARRCSCSPPASAASGPTPNRTPSPRSPRCARVCRWRWRSRRPAPPPGPPSRWPPWRPNCATAPGGWTPWTPGIRRPACGRCSPGPISSSAPTRRGCSGCWACTLARTSPPPPPPAWPPPASPRPVSCWAS